MDIIATHKTSSIIVLFSISKQCLHAEPINCFQIHLKSILYIWLGLLVSIYCLHCTLAIILHACLENLLMLCKFKTVFLNFICQQCGVEHLFICVLWSNITYIVPIKKEIYIYNIHMDSIHCSFCFFEILFSKYSLLNLICNNFFKRLSPWFYRHFPLVHCQEIDIKPVI